MTDLVQHHKARLEIPVARPGCPFNDLRQKLRGVGLRPTRQRVSLGWLLYAKGDRHVSAEILYEEALRARVPVSLATVYNTLHQFTNVSDHHHFFVEGEDNVIDVPSAAVEVTSLPTPPEGFEIARVDVVVRLKRIQP